MARLEIVGSPSAARFESREAAGAALASALATYRATDALVLGIPRSGMEVADALAQVLELDFDVLMAHKLLAPGRPDVTIGGVAEGDVLVWSDDVIESLGISDDERHHELFRVAPELAAQERNYRSLLPRAPVHGRCVILADDAVVTGATMRAAVEAVIEAGPGRLVVAVPGGRRGVLEDLAALEHVHEVVALAAPERLESLTQLYTSLPRVSEHWVCHILRAAYQRRRARRKAFSNPQRRFAHP